QHDPDHAGPDIQRRPDMTGHQPAGHQFEDHDAEAAEEGQQVGQETISGGEAVHAAQTPRNSLRKGETRLTLSDLDLVHNRPGDWSSGKIAEILERGPEALASSPSHRREASKASRSIRF